MTKHIIDYAMKNASKEVGLPKVVRDCKVEIFKDVKGYYGKYRISNLGRVLSVGREVYYNHSRTGRRIKRKTKDRILVSCEDKCGYLHVTLLLNSTQTTLKIHKLVAINFLNHKPNKHEMVIDHIDGNKQNNRLNNLQIKTQRENILKSNIDRTSKYIGVSYHKGTKKWASQIYFNGKVYYLGVYNCEYKAHLAYVNKLNELK